MADRGLLRKGFGGYLLTCAAVLLAAALIRLLQAIGYQGLSPLFAALIVSAWYGGVGPAALGILLTTLAAYLPAAQGERRAALPRGLPARRGLHPHGHGRRRGPPGGPADRGGRPPGAAAAEQASEAKTRLLAMVSHDLKNPLNPILMALAVAEQDPVVAERRGRRWT